MTKLFDLILLCLILCVASVLCGCSHVSTVTREIECNRSMFVEVEQATYWSVYYHKDTKVMYVCSKGMYNGGNMTVMLDADGKPLLWEGGDYE